MLHVKLTTIIRFVRPTGRTPLKAVLAAAVAVLLTLVPVTTPLAQLLKENVPALDSIDIVEHLGDKIPLDLEFINDKGNPVTLGDYFKTGRPVILIMGYYECPMLCNLVFNGLSDAVRQLDLEIDRQYQIITVSFNATETSELAAAKKENYLAASEGAITATGWDFLVGLEENSRALAEALGFKYYYDEKQEQFAHAAVVHVLADDGTISRYLYGIEFQPKDLRLAVLEASQGKIGTTLDRIILYCYAYDPEAGGYVLMASNLMRLGGLVMVFIMITALFVLWWRQRRRRRLLQPAASHRLVAKD